MESKVIFRDYQEQQAQDHNDLQEFAERTFDHIVLDAVTAERRYAGFQCTKTGQTEIQISPGRMYDVLGVVNALNTTTTQSMISYLAAAYTRYVLLTAVGTDVETDIEERDYLIDVTTGATEPRAVATTRSRAAVLTFTSGVESGDPIRPAVPISHCAIAYILLDTTQVVSIEMVETNRVTSTDSLDLRVDACELFDSIIGPKVSSLASDLADLMARVAALAQLGSVKALAMDLARVKATLRYPASAADYGTDWFLDALYSNVDNDLALGYDAKIEEGLRFGDANADEFEITLFSANDPNATYQNGLLLPRYQEVFRLATYTGSTGYTTLGIAQYGFQTVEMKVGYMSRSRLRYGGSYFACSNAEVWDSNDIWGSVTRSSAASFNPASILYPDGTVSTRMIMEGQTWHNPYNHGHEIVRRDNWWYDEWKEPYIYAVTVDHTITGAMIAQSFLVPSDIWATSVWIYIAAKGANEDIHLSICEMLAGVPNLERCIVKVIYAHANIVVGWNKIVIPATFMLKGSRYAAVFVSNANHQVGMFGGQEYLDGTFYYSTDGIYYQGDLTKDLMMQIWGARFDNSQVTIEFAPINLDGGLRHVDILCEMIRPASTNLYWEMRPNGTGEWQPLVQDNTEVLALAPPLCQFRARFDGTHDVHTGVRLTGSRVHVSRPKVVFKHVSEPLTLASGCIEVIVAITLENFNETPHDHTMTMRTGATLAVIENPDVTTTKVSDLARRRYERTYTFTVSPAVTNICFIQDGTTNSPLDCFHVAERTFYSHA
jgi:hypothetical protein